MCTGFSFASLHFSFAQTIFTNALHQQMQPLNLMLFDLRDVFLGKLWSMNHLATLVNKKRGS